ncbi:MAG: ATP-binding protein [Ardenticatenaceae bacterium]|nr:ATP-binding protein [Ardenticatenaceae bacterium]
MDETVIRIDIPATHQHLNILGACLSALLERVDFLTDKEMLLYNLELALHETCTNIVEHAYDHHNGGRIKASMALQSKPERKLVVDIHDSGKSFVMDNVKSPDLENAQVHGYGLFLMRQLLDEVIYQPSKANNHWRLVKNL